MSSAIEQEHLGHSVRVYSPEHELGICFPALTIKGLALELAEMLREVLPELEISVVSYCIAGQEAVEIEAATERAKRRVIEARESDSPGAAFLDGIGYWSFGAKPTQE